MRSLENVIKEYFNRAGRLMEDYYADLYTDIEHIKNIRFNSALYFIIQPNGSHVCGEDEYNDIRDACADYWGNYCVFKIYLIKEGYEIKNWDVLLTKNFDTQDERIINNYKEFKIGN